MAYCDKWTALFHRKFSDFSGTVPDIESATKLVQIYETENKLNYGFSESVATVQDTGKCLLKVVGACARLRLRRRGAGYG